MAQIRTLPSRVLISRVSEHPRDLGYGLNLHLRARPAPIARVIVGIDLHGQGIRRPRHRMRRFQHLPGIQGMEIRIVIAQPVRRLLKNLRHGLRARARLRLKLWQGVKLRLQGLGGVGQ